MSSQTQRKKLQQVKENSLKITPWRDEEREKGRENRDTCRLTDRENRARIRKTEIKHTWNIGRKWHHASRWPPGIMDGPYRAPSSPPDTPHPQKSIPFALVVAHRLCEKRSGTEHTHATTKDFSYAFSQHNQRWFQHFENKNQKKAFVHQRFCIVSDGAAHPLPDKSRSILARICASEKFTSSKTSPDLKLSERHRTWTNTTVVISEQQLMTCIWQIQDGRTYFGILILGVATVCNNIARFQEMQLPTGTARTKILTKENIPLKKQNNTS